MNHSSAVEKRFSDLPSKKRRKKRKSVVYKAKTFTNKKFQKSPKNSPNLRSVAHEILLTVPLRPSTSEENFNDMQIKSELSSNNSFNIYNQQNEKSDESISESNKHNEVICYSGIKACDSTDFRPKNRFEEFFSESFIFNDNNSCTGDINDIIYEGHSNIETVKEESEDDSSNIDPFDSIFEEVDEKALNESSDIEANDHSFEIYENKTDLIIILKYQDKVPIFGYSNIKVLFGKINILGFTLTSESPEYIIYSPRGTALLTLKNNSNFCDRIKHIRNVVPQLSEEKKFKDLTMRMDSTVIKLVKTFDFKLNLIEDHIAQKILPKHTSKPCIEIEPKGIWNVLSVCSEWDSIIRDVTRASRLFLCGGKGVGKSTFLRYAINCLLQKYGCVRVIDLDPGQSEFTVPGTLSIATILEPVLGTNYTHLRKTDRSILCDINVSLDPHKYVRCIEEIKIAEKESNVPTLINFMGYINDIAFHIFSSAVVTLQPDKIIYLQSNNRRKNFKIKMTKQTIMEHAQLFSTELPAEFNVEIVKIFSMTDNNSGWTLEPRQMREMCILAYFGQIVNENIKTLQSHKLPMYEVNLHEVNITDQYNSKVDYEAINGNIVALSTILDETNSLFECIGWAIVRAVDASKNRAIIITPVDEDLLEQITHLVVGCLTLPPSIYMNNENVHERIPYVMKGELIDFAQMSKRTRIPIKRRYTECQ